MLVSLSVIAVLLVLSAFFSGSETALTAASRPLIHQLARKGDRRAAAVTGTENKPSGQDGSDGQSSTEHQRQPPTAPGGGRPFRPWPVVGHIQANLGQGSLGEPLRGRGALTA